MAKPKLSDFLTNIFKQIGIEQKDSDLILSASALREIELPEDIQTKFDAGFFTPERAKSEIGATLKPEHFGHFATDLERNSLKTIIDSLPDQYKQEIAGLEKTNRVYNIIKVIEKAFSEVKTNGSTEDIKKVNETHRKIVEDLNKAILEKETLLKTKESEFETRIAENKIDYALRGKIGSVKLAPEFEKRRTFIEDLTLSSLKNKGLLVEFDKENPQVMHLRQRKDGAITDVYEGNTKVTLDNFLEKELNDFILKSNGNGSNNGNPNPTPSNHTATKLPSDRPLSLQEMRAQAGE